MTILTEAKDFLVRAESLSQEALREAYKALSEPVRNAYRRLRVERAMKTPLEDQRKEHLSPSEKYRLVITPYHTGKGTWNYSEGLLYRQGDTEPFQRVVRNYGSFPFSWIEGHANGHDYLLCGEDYQGQTVIELDTGDRVDHMPKSAESGVGFCWADHHPSPDGMMIAVEGCYWACPYEVIIVDFSHPMQVPWPELARDSDNEDFIGWIDNTSCKIGRKFDWSIKHGKREHDLTDAEMEECDELEESLGFSEVWEYRSDSIVWTRPPAIEVARKYIQDTFGWRKENGVPVVADHMLQASMLLDMCSEDDQAILKAEAETGPLYEWALNHVGL